MLKNKSVLNILLVFMLLLFLGLIYLFNNVEVNTKKSKTIIKIDVRGEINNPGVFEFELGSTYQDLFKLLDFKKDSDITSFNLNTKLSNNEVITIPNKKEDKLISINSASIDELSTLKGIGASLASEIINYREEYGGFKQLEDLINVKGIGKKKFNNIKEYITL